MDSGDLRGEEGEKQGRSPGRKEAGLAVGRRGCTWEIPGASEANNKGNIPRGGKEPDGKDERGRQQTNLEESSLKEQQAVALQVE